jgi:hypothetical protein
MLVSLCVLMVWPTLRHLPAGARLALRGLPRRMRTGQRVLGVMLVVFAAVLLFLAFTPGPVWAVGDGILGAIVGDSHVPVFAAVWFLVLLAQSFRGRR